MEGGGAVRVTLPQRQNEVGPFAVITGVGGRGFTVTKVGSEIGDTQRFTSVTTTVNVPEAVTVMLDVLDPFDQRKLPEPDAES